MNRFILLVLLVVFTFSIAAGKDKLLTISKEKVVLIISEDSSEVQLRKLKKQLKEEANIDFNFKDVIFDSRNKIKKITIEVDSNDGMKKSGILMTSNIYNVGFIRDFTITDSDSIEKAIVIGNISEKEVRLK